MPKKRKNPPETQPSQLQSIGHRGHIFLAAYSIFIQKRGEKNNPLPLNDFDNEGTSLIDELERIIPSINNRESEKDEAARAFRITQMAYDKENDYYKCTAKCGSFGRKFEVVNVYDDNVNYIGEEYEAPVQEFNFSIKFSRKYPSGHLIFQRNSNWGIRTAFLNALRKNWPHKDYIVWINPVAIKEVIDKYVMADITTDVAFVQHQIPSSTFKLLNFQARNQNSESKKTVSGKIEVKIKSCRGSYLKGLARDLINSKKPNERMLETLHFTNFNPDQMSFTLEDLDGRLKTFVVNREKEPRTYLDVTKSVIDDGVINQEKLFDEMLSLTLRL